MDPIVFAIDPGNEQSAYLTYCGAVPLEHGIMPNNDLLHMIRGGVAANHLACEGIACYGMPVGKEVFDTCIWIGRFIEAWDDPWSLVYRPQVKLHLCGSARAKDPNVRQALIDKFGPGREKAIGTKKAPGPLYGVSSHVWSALAVAVTWSETT